MSTSYTFDDLKKDVAEGRIDTVLACQVDMQGRLMGKRFQAEFFVESAWKETHSCNYLQATDLEMETVSGYKSTSWEKGYGDYTMKPDLATLRRIPWLEGTALVLCDVLDHHTHEEVAHSPRAILKKQIRRLEAMGMKAFMASELEFFLFDQSYDSARESGYRNLHLVSGYNEDYPHLPDHQGRGCDAGDPHRLAGRRYSGREFQGRGLGRAGGNQCPLCRCAHHGRPPCDHQKRLQGDCLVEGQGHHFPRKVELQCCRQFVAYPPVAVERRRQDAAVLRQREEHGMTPLMKHYVAGLLTHASEITYFLAPYINSYKRFVAGTFAPTKAIWSTDNRTAGYRLCGAETKGIRIECRVGGSDLNPYLAFAALIAAGLDGIQNKLELEAPFVGDAYGAREVREIPRTLRDAAVALTGSKMLRAAFGDDVIDHYTRAAEWEQEEYDRRITDWEVARGVRKSLSLSVVFGICPNFVARRGQGRRLRQIAPLDGVRSLGVLPLGRESRIYS